MNLYGNNLEQLRVTARECSKIYEIQVPFSLWTTFFTEGALRSILRIDDSMVLNYLSTGFEQTRQTTLSMFKLPTFQKITNSILSQYQHATPKVRLYSNSNCVGV